MLNSQSKLLYHFGYINILLRKGRKVRRGNLGHIIIIANQIVKAGENNPEIQEYLDNNTAWKEFTQTTLKQINETNTTELGGVNPRDIISKGSHVIIIF